MGLSFSGSFRPITGSFVCGDRPQSTLTDAGNVSSPPNNTVDNGGVNSPPGNTVDNGNITSPA